MSTQQYPDDESVEETGLNLFDDRASLAGSFPHAMFGYDRTNVDTHVREIEQQLSTLKQLTRHLRQQLRETQLSQGTTDFTRLGSHATGVLRAAEAQAKDIVARAELEAERIKEEGRRVASDLRANAQTEADDIRVAGLSNLRELRADLDRNVEQTLAAARADADSTVAAAQRHADGLRVEAEQNSANLVRAAENAAQRLRAETERANAEAVLATRQQIDEMLARAEAAFEETRAASEQMLADSSHHHEQSALMLRSEAEQAQKIRDAALADAEQVKAQAARDAEAQIAGAHRQASMMKDRLEEQFAWRREQIERETNALLQRKASVIAQLANLRQLAGESALDFPDDDPFDAPGAPGQGTETQGIQGQGPVGETAHGGAPSRDASTAGPAVDDVFDQEQLQPTEVVPTGSHRSGAADTTGYEATTVMPGAETTHVTEAVNDDLEHDPRSRRS